MVISYLIKTNNYCRDIIYDVDYIPTLILRYSILKLINYLIMCILLKLQIIQFLKVIFIYFMRI